MDFLHPAGSRSTDTGRVRVAIRDLLRYPQAPQWPSHLKHPAISMLVSFFLPGVGSMINGDVGTGVAILLLWLVSFPLMFFFIGFVTVFAAFIWGLVDAYQGARRWNFRHGIIS